MVRSNVEIVCFDVLGPVGYLERAGGSHKEVCVPRRGFIF